MDTMIWSSSEALNSPSRPTGSVLLRKLAWWGSAATGAIVTNTALLLVLLYVFSVIE